MREGGRERGKKGEREGGREGGREGEREEGREGGREGEGEFEGGWDSERKNSKLLCLNKEVSHVGIVLQHPHYVHNYGLHKHSYCNC